jgi:hypothetical protein
LIKQADVTNKISLGDNTPPKMWNTQKRYPPKKNLKAIFWGDSPN